MITRNVSESTKKSIVRQQRNRCANEPGLGKNMRGLEGYQCPLWMINKGLFDESGYEIDHIIEYSPDKEDKKSDRKNNLQALCISCHSVKTRRFNSRQNGSDSEDDSKSEQSKARKDDSDSEDVSGSEDDSKLEQSKARKNNTKAIKAIKARTAEAKAIKAEAEAKQTEAIEKTKQVEAVEKTKQMEIQLKLQVPQLNNNPVEIFINTCFDIVDDPKKRIRSSVVYQLFRSFNKDDQIGDKKMKVALERISNNKTYITYVASKGLGFYKNMVLKKYELIENHIDAKTINSLIKDGRLSYPKVPIRK
jgi:5-methylcytosine-specific restriction endonuclease McrA